MSPRWRWSVVAFLVVATLGVLDTLAPAGAKPARQRLDLKVAHLDGGRCADYADDAPVLVNLPGAQPGTNSDIVGLCLQNAGSIAGRLTMHATDRLDREVGCSAGESAVDPTCGDRQAGELGTFLRHVVARDRNCTGSTKQPIEASFTSIETTPVVLSDTVGPGQVFCVRVWARYEGATVDDELAAQSDEVTWRYSFALTSP